MEQFLDFAVRNWFLFAALFVILGLLIGSELIRKIRGVTAISPAQALQLMNHEEAVVLDVRDGAEYKSGHIPDARHIPHNEIKDRLKELTKVKSRPIIVYCQTGNRAATVGALLKKEEFNTVHTLQGGLPAWQSANLPISKKGK